MSDSWKVDLETKVAHQEVTIESLQEAVFEHQKEIDRLKNKLEQVLNHIASGNSGGLDIGPADEKPPHY